MSARIAIAPEAVNGLAGRIGQVHADLESAKATFGDPYGGIRSRRVEDALEHFNGAWSQKRSKLVGQLGDARDVLVNTEQEFTGADTRLAGGLNGEASADGSATSGGGR